MMLRWGRMDPGDWALGIEVNWDHPYGSWIYLQFIKYEIGIEWA